MPRRLRVSSGGYAYHVLNRAVGRRRIFGKERDFEAFEKVIEQAKARLPMRVLAWCVMSNHWHFVLWPRGDGDLSEFMRWLTVTQTQRWHAAHRTAGTGPLYQGRFKSFPIQEDDHLWMVLPGRWQQHVQTPQSEAELGGIKGPGGNKGARRIYWVVWGYSRESCLRIYPNICDCPLEVPLGDVHFAAGRTHRYASFR